MSNPFKTEDIHEFKVYYQNVFVKSITAHSRWEAEDKAYQMFKEKYPHIIRSQFKAKK